MTTTIDTPETPAVALYTMPQCFQCRATSRWLDKNEVAYTTIDVSQDLEALNYIQDLDYASAPVIVLSTGEHWSQFRPDLLEKHLAS